MYSMSVDFTHTNLETDRFSYIEGYYFMLLLLVITSKEKIWGGVVVLQNTTHELFKDLQNITTRQVTLKDAL